jgi:mono/diheme cytochrome c family protein
MSRITSSGAALLLALFTAAAVAQTGDAVRGRDLWSDTPGVSGIQMITANCSNCHTVDQRRSQIGGSTFADISFDTAMARFSQALNNQSAMATFRQLQPQDVYDLAAYVADTPKTTVANLDFTASAVNTATAAQTVDLRHSAAPLGGAALSVTGVAIGGSGASAFTIASNACTNATLAANNTCRVSITFSSPDTAGKTATLTLSLRQGTTNFSRSVALSGAVAGANGGGGGSSGDSGGGALGLGWLAALATATLALAATRRSGSGRARRVRSAAARRAAR